MNTFLHWRGIAVVVLFLCPMAMRADERLGARDVRAVPPMDLARYAGTWYEIARMPNRFQDKCAGDVTATYTVREDGDITVVNRCATKDGGVTEVTGRARLAERNGPNTKLEVRFAPAWLSFLPMVWADYWVIDLAPDYSFAVIGEPKRTYLWILSRTPTLDENTLQGIYSRLRDQGYDPATLMNTHQSAAR